MDARHSLKKFSGIFHFFKLSISLSNQLTFETWFWAVGGSQSVWRKPSYAQGEHATSTQKERTQPGFEPESSHYEVGVKKVKNPLIKFVSFFSVKMVHIFLLFVIIRHD